MNTCEETVSVSVNELICSARILIIGIADVHDRKTFNKSLIEAITANDFKKIRSIFSVVSKYVEDQDKTCSRRKGRVYDTAPTFLQAGLDFVHDLCNDLLNIPNLSEYYSAVEREAFPDTSDWNTERSKKSTTRVPRSIDIFVKKDMILVIKVEKRNLLSPHPSRLF